MPASWGRVPVWWARHLRDAGASATARDVLVLLAAHASKKTGEAWPSIETMAASLHVSTRTIRRATAELKRVGLLEIQARNKRRGESNLYRLPFDKAELQGTKYALKSPTIRGHMGSHKTDSGRVIGGQSRA